MKYKDMIVSNDDYMTTDEAYQNLANAIVLQAVSDWRTGNSVMRETAGNFFRSDWFLLLTKLSPDYLIERLKREEKKYGKKNHSATA